MGPTKSPRALVFIHGLGGSVFSMQHVVENLVDKNTAVLTFNNRGHDVISRIKTRATKKAGLGGAAHERFTDCVDDINGAVRFARKQGAKEIYLMGHSTGCQKSMYWAAKGGRGVKGIILLAPVSDYAAGLKKYGKKKLERVERVARALVAKGRKHALIPPEVWPETLDAQRFVSLYTPSSTEEIFSYSQPDKHPTLLTRVKIPLLVLWAGKDEYASHASNEVTDWFRKHLSSRKSEVQVLKNANHGFKKEEEGVIRYVRKWLEKI